jgi:hypothetical protein
MTPVTTRLSASLAEEVCKDLNYNEIYSLAIEMLSRRFLRKNNLESLCEEYGERYDYVFLDNGVDPLNIGSSKLVL